MNKVFYAIPACIILVLIIMTVQQKTVQSTALSEGTALPEFRFVHLHLNKPIDPSRVLTHTYGLPKGAFLINFFGSWCVSCRLQHSTLMHLMKKEHVSILGFALKDTEQGINHMLNNHGNPYIRIGIVPDSYNFSQKWGITQTPTTFVVDSKGLIRHRFDKIITPKDVEQTVLPMLEKLKNNSS